MSSWLSATLQSVRDKSLDALDFVKKDLAEFTSTVKTDTETYLTKIKAPEVSNVSLDRLMPKWNNSDDGMQLHGTASFDRFQNELQRIQNDESTYLRDPNPVEPYQNWRETSDFNVETRKGEISQLLIDAPHVRALYARFVPAETSHGDFWARYYFRVHQLEEDEARRTKLIQRAHEICENKNDDQDLNQGNDWDEPEDQWSEPLPKEPSATPVVPEALPPPPVVEEKPVMPPVESASKENDEGSGDSWEHEFDDESDTSSSKTNPTTEETEPPIAAAAAGASASEKKPPNELDDDWEAWS